MLLHLPLVKLSHWQRIAFSAVLIERMLPNYQLFSQSVEFGDVKVLRNQLNLVWQWLDKNNRTKINFDAQLAKLEEQIPTPEDYDFFGVQPALDVAMAIMQLFQAMQDKELEGFTNVSLLSQNSVSAYVELLLLQELSDDEAQQVEFSKADIKAHPLGQWEVDSQNEAFDFIKNAPENKVSCDKLKALVVEPGLSNLGIEV